MIYKNRRKNIDGEIYYEISHRSADTKDVVDTYGDWDEFMIRFPSEDMLSMMFDTSMETLPDEVVNRVSLVRELERIKHHYDGILECKIRAILQENSFPADVLDALPEFIATADFDSESFHYSYKDGENSKTGVIVDSILQWYREPEEGVLSCYRDEFGNWKSIEKP